jgi:hypothetical protein
MSKKGLLTIIVIGSGYLVRGFIVTTASNATFLGNPIVIMVGLIVAVCVHFYLKD